MKNKSSNQLKLNYLLEETPCQSFSVAGLRKGLSDPRGNLALEFLRLVDIKRPRWFVWENVPGVLSSSGGRDFGSFIGAVQKLGYGFCYRILDAQYFGVPQRRRRVFVVGYFGDWRRAAAVLFERESLCGNIKKGRKTRQGITDSIEESIDGEGKVVPCWWDGEQVSANITARSHHQNMPDKGNFECVLCPTVTSKWAKGSGGPAGSETGNLVMSFNWMENHNFKTSTKSSNPLRVSQTEAVSYEYYSHDFCHDRVLSASGVSPALNVSQSHQFRMQAHVRRLTPRECERLQGFPDNYTLLPNLKKAADGPRYKALGNSMAVPCMRWIGERIAEVDCLKGGS